MAGRDFDFSDSPDGFGPLDARAYELAEERQRAIEEKGSGDCCECKVHSVYKGDLCVHCYCHNQRKQGQS